MNTNIKVSPSHELLEELKTAVFNCDFLAIEASLRKGAKCNLPYNHQGWTPFLRACREFDETEIIELFLKHGADINDLKAALTKPDNFVIIKNKHIDVSPRPCYLLSVCQARPWQLLFPHQS